jgi:hypothetical protein
MVEHVWILLAHRGEPSVSQGEEAREAGEATDGTDHAEELRG